jgi:predicted benzoate:H+ symporter BenE
MRALSSFVGPWPWVRWLAGLALLASLMLSAPVAGKSANAKAAADYFVHSLPGAPAGVPLVKMHAG